MNGCLVRPVRIGQGLGARIHGLRLALAPGWRQVIQQTIAQPYINRHWAKSDRGQRERIHLLEHHLADVGACFKTLLAQPTIRCRLAHAGGLDDLCDTTIARLSVFAALHDIGKLNVGFQAKIWPDADTPRWLRSSRKDSSHTLDMVPVLMDKDRATADWLLGAIGWWSDLVKWDNTDGETACGLLVATFSHHGRPLPLEGGRERNPDIWRDFGALSPKECAERICGLLREWFPRAFDADAEPLPSEPAFQHMFLGLCTLADWIGSNESFFPYVDTRRDDYFKAMARPQAAGAIDAIGLNISEQRRIFSGMSLPDFGALFHDDESSEVFVPNAIQEAANQDTPLEQRIVVIESETGSGKTEAALWRFAKMYEDELVDGIYFALPTRAAAAQIHGRVKRFAASLFAGQDAPPVVLAVPGYEPDADADSVRLQEYDEHAAGEHHHEAQSDDKPWASENPKRYLAAQIAVGTVDQAMMGALKVKHAHLRAACLARNLLVVDEVHASDAYMRRILEALLEAHTGAGGYALLMSATLGSEARRRLLSAGNAASAYPTLPLDDAIDTPYPAVSVGDADRESVQGVGENGRTKRVLISAHPIMPDFDATAETALKAARDGAKVLVVRNTVGHAVETQRALERLAGERDNGLLFKLNGTPTLHHGRFAALDRRLLDRQVEAYLDKDAERGAGCVIIGTQTLEQSLDIDADLLITDLCPMDVLLQRIGRLHRHEREDRAAGYETPRCIVLTPPNNDLSPLLEWTESANGLGPKGGVYEDLRILEATLRLISERGEWEIPAMNRELVERATHPAALEEIVAELGDDWRTHANEVEGGRIADGLTARGAIIRRDKSFFMDNREVLFGSLEEKIRTRLGDERVDIVFAAPQDSPFGQEGAIDKVAMRLSWLDGVDVPESVSASAVEGVVEFAGGVRRFRYDRLGLHRL